MSGENKSTSAAALPTSTSTTVTKAFSTTTKTPSTPTPTIHTMVSFILTPISGNDDGKWFYQVMVILTDAV